MTDASNREVLEYNGSSGAIGNWYAYALGPNAVLNQMNVATGTRATFIPDILGSIVGSLDATSGTLTKFGYQTYGESSAPSGSFGYTGQRIDPETGLYYYRGRMYATAWGRFPQTDPIGYRGGSNLYAYVGNDPLNLVDALGLSPDSPAAQSWLQTSMQGIASAFNAGMEQSAQAEIETAQLQTQFAQQNPVGYAALNFGAPLVAAGAMVALPELATALAAPSSLSAVEQLAINRAAGAAFEDAADIIANTQRIPSLTGTAAYRVPDVLNSATQIIGEVKNVSHLSLTSQIQDYLLYAQQTGYTFQLTVRTTTAFSRPLAQTLQAPNVSVVALPW